ncbi:MAG: DUF5710 domain-containing protein [Polyangiaceae bacterium]
MPRVELQVPFPQKDEAKRLGARWDNQKRVWYVPDGLDTAPFKKWLPKTRLPDVRAGYYYIAQTYEICWKCGQVSAVFGLLVPPGHETDEGRDGDGLEFESDAAFEAWANSPESQEWEKSDTAAFIFFVSTLPAAVQAQMTKLTKSYRIDFSKTLDDSYWMNHCEHCDAKLGDHPMYTPPATTFCPDHERAAALISLHRVSEPIEACCGSMLLDPPFIECMRGAEV